MLQVEKTHKKTVRLKMLIRVRFTKINGEKLSLEGDFAFIFLTQAFTSALQLFFFVTKEKFFLDLFGNLFSTSA